MHCIVSDTHRVVVNPLGAELTSFCSVELNNEMMWQGDPAYWSGIAPVLFPIVGELRNGKMRNAGKSFAMQRHGFVRKREFVCENQAANQLRCVFESDQSALQSFPWCFRFTVTFTLDQNTLHVDYAVENLDKRTMLFNLGSHPAFALPLQNRKIEDYRITFNRPENLQRIPLNNNLLVRTPVPFMPDREEESGLVAIRLADNLFDDDALIFANINSSVLTLEYSPLGSRVSRQRVSVATGGAPHLGIWAKPAAPYVCIEPWWGYADFEDASGDFAEKDSIQSLRAGEIFSSRLSVTAFADF